MTSQTMATQHQDPFSTIWTRVVVPFAGALLVWAVVHTFRTRPLGDIWFYAVRIAGVVVFVGWIVVYLIIRAEKDKGFFSRGALWLLGAIITLFVSLVLGIIYYSFAVSFMDIYRWTQSHDIAIRRGVNLGLFAGALPLAAGGILFYFRLKLRSVYGMTEAIAGVAAAALLITNSNAAPQSSAVDQRFVLTFITASIYLVVRGFDNIHTGMTKQPLDPVVVMLKDWVRSRID